jgi:AIPR protein
MASIASVCFNNNRQNPVEPWNLHANDLIQLELQEKFRDDPGIYYERQENAFDQLSPEDLEDYGITEDSRAIQTETIRSKTRSKLVPV